MGEVEACMATYSLFACAATDHQRQAASGQGLAKRD